MEGKKRLKSSEDNHNSFPYNMEVLRGTGLINAREIVNSYPLAAETNKEGE